MSEIELNYLNYLFISELIPWLMVALFACLAIRNIFVIRRKGNADSFDDKLAIALSLIVTVVCVLALVYNLDWYWIITAPESYLLKHPLK